MNDRFDIIIRHGAILDGTGGDRRSGDIGINGDRITAIEDLSHADGGTAIDADGCYVCPGFIDVHSHSDAYLLIEPSAPSKVCQGITTEVVGNCGASAAPVVGAFEMSSDWREHEYPGEWHSMAEYRALLEEVGPAPNVLVLVGHKALRVGVAGYAHREVSDSELAGMCGLLERCLDEGARGLSTGLIYAPGMFATHHELTSLCKVVAGKDGIYTSHMRNERQQVLEAIREVIDIARDSGVRAEVSHLKAPGGGERDFIGEALALIAGAREEGLNLAADRYPYLSGYTDLDVVFPAWAHEGGPAAMLARLADDVERPRLAEELESRARGFWEGIMIGSTQHEKKADLQGAWLLDAAGILGLSPVETVLHLVETDRGRTSAFFHGMTEENMLRILAAPYVMVGTDASLRALTGPLSKDHPHPRAYGSFPKFLRMSLDGKTVPLAEAVRKITSLPANHFGMSDRGEIARDKAADIVVFDPATVRDTADYAGPHSLAEGISHVIINGTHTVADGKLTGSRAGRWL